MSRDFEVQTCSEHQTHKLFFIQMARQAGYRTLDKLDRSTAHAFEEPKKCINDGDTDLPFFLTSWGYTDITTFLLQLNISMFPQKAADSSSKPKAFPLISSTSTFSPTVQSIQALLNKLKSLIKEIPPDPGPRRFGNISFRRWHEQVEENTPQLLSEHLSASVLDFPGGSSATARDEIQAYFLGGFGSAQRLDYGTGHELSFLAFLGCLWKLGTFDVEAPPGVEERGIVIGILESYFELIRDLIMTYNLEPAGSHGVWGLDDHCFLPYIFGSAQLSPPISALDGDFKPESIPTEGSLPNAPKPSDVTSKDAVDRERQDNMYFRAIGFIYDVKKGPFWEHSRVLYDISGIPTGWAKINKVSQCFRYFFSWLFAQAHTLTTSARGCSKCTMPRSCRSSQSFNISHLAHCFAGSKTLMLHLHLRQHTLPTKPLQD